MLFFIVLLLCTTTTSMAVEKGQDRVIEKKTCDLPVRPKVFITRDDIKQYLAAHRVYMKCISGAK